MSQFICKDRFRICPQQPDKRKANLRIRQDNPIQFA